MVKKRRSRRLVKAIDANIAVRVLMRDNARQVATADRAVRAGVFIPLTVILETGWLLRSRYGLPRPDIAEALFSLIDLPEVMVTDAVSVKWAIERFATTGDFADLIHLVASAGMDGFQTFDRNIARDAGSSPPVPVEVLGG